MLDTRSEDATGDHPPARFRDPIRAKSGPLGVKAGRRSKAAQLLGEQAGKADSRSVFEVRADRLQPDRQPLPAQGYGEGRRRLAGKGGDPRINRLEVVTDRLAVHVDSSRALRSRRVGE